MNFYTNNLVLNRHYPYLFPQNHKPAVVANGHSSPGTFQPAGTALPHSIILRYSEPLLRTLDPPVVPPNPRDTPRRRSPGPRTDRAHPDSCHGALRTVKPPFTPCATELMGRPDHVRIADRYLTFLQWDENLPILERSRARKWVRILRDFFSVNIIYMYYVFINAT